MVKKSRVPLYGVSIRHEWQAHLSARVHVAPPTEPQRLRRPLAPVVHVFVFSNVSIFISQTIQRRFLSYF